MNEFNLNKEYNWETAHKPLIKKYVADLFQENTDAPVAKELFNNTGLYFQYEYLAPGVYAVVASENIFTNPVTFSGANQQKTQINVTNASYIDLSTTGGFSIVTYPVTENEFIILSTGNSGDADDIIGNFTQNALEITFYK